VTAMRDLLASYDAWIAEGHRVGRAVVIRTFGSAPRREGAVLLVADDGRMVGSVSGGCVEGAAAEEVARAIASGRSRVIRYGISDEQAWDVGLACGGTIDVLAEGRIDPGLVAASRRLGSVVATPLPPVPPPTPEAASPSEAETQPPVVLEGRPHDPGEVPATTSAPGAEALPGPIIEAAERAGRSGLSELVAVEPDRAWFLEAFPHRPRLVVVGATEVSRHLVALARSLEYETIVVDPRSAFATAERFPDVDALLVDWPDEAFATLGLGPTDAVAVLSHDPKVDEPAIAEAIRRGAGYVGAVGSRRTQAGRRERLAAAGLSPDEIARVHGPIGLDLGGREPVETALAILAEVVAARRGGTGRPLIEVRGAITGRA